MTAARVVRVVDGATIDVDIDGRIQRVRYLGIEIPSGEISGSREQLIGREALAFNRFLVDGRTVELERGVVDADALGRLLRYVYVDGEMVNEALLTNGYATVAAFPPTLRRRSVFLAAEESAQSGLRGVWEPSPSSRAAADNPSGGHPAQEFSGGTLPRAPGSGDGPVCDYSGTNEPQIKGNYDPRTGERVYHIPGGFFYETTVVTVSDGDRWFCTEADALLAGWRRSTR